VSAPSSYNIPAQAVFCLQAAILTEFAYYTIWDDLIQHTRIDVCGYVAGDFSRNACSWGGGDARRMDIHIINSHYCPAAQHKHTHV